MKINLMKQKKRVLNCKMTSANTLKSLEPKITIWGVDFIGYQKQ